MLFAGEIKSNIRNLGVIFILNIEVKKQCL